MKPLQKLKNALVVLTSGVMLAVTGPAAASVIAFSEGADLSDTPAAHTSLGSFDIGLNTVSGSIIRQTGDRADAWEATLGVGLEIVSIFIDVQLAQTCTPPGNVGNGHTRNLRLDSNLISNTGFSCDTGPTQPFGNLTFPLTTVGLYGFALGNINSSSTIQDVSSYTWTVEVDSVASQVPEPTTLLLLGVGLAGLGFARKRLH